jgi:transcriptional regulator with XRE-family HTH domain
MSMVRSIRSSLGLDQKTLGQKLGLSQSAISRLETGVQPLDERTKLALEALQMHARENTPVHADVDIPAEPSLSVCNESDLTPPAEVEAEPDLPLGGSHAEPELPVIGEAA